MAAETLTAHASALRDIAMTYPEAHEDFPWGEPAIKVRGKVFVFMGSSQGRLGITVKLPDTHMAALMFDFAEPTGYGLGKHGWISARFGPDDDVPVGLLAAWIDESYRAVAPKRLIARLGA